MLLIIACLAILLYGLYIRHRLTYWSRKGVKGPMPLPLVGTIWHYFFDEFWKIDLKMNKTYGPIHGEYEGQVVQTLVVSDPDLAKRVLITDFTTFATSDKPFITEPPFNKMLTSLTGPEWKNVRSAASTTFSSAKLRRSIENHLQKPMENALENIKELIAEGKLEKTQFKQLCRHYALDVIAKYVFAIEINSFKKTNNEFVKNSLAFVNFRIWAFVLIQIMPRALGDYLLGFVIDPKSIVYMNKMSGEVYRERKENADIKYKDFIELMVESGNELTREQIVSQTAFFYFAGLDTLSTQLSILIWHMASWPDHQQRIYDEIVEIIGDQEPNYDNIAQLEFLDAFMHESVRMHPALSRIQRYSVAPFEFDIDGQKIAFKNDQSIQVSVTNIHYNDKIFESPFEFNPERFMGENKKELKKSVLTFSAGPRACVGQRFAIMEIKFFVIHLLRMYICEKSKDAPNELAFHKGLFFLSPKDLRIKLVPRD